MRGNFPARERLDACALNAPNADSHNLISRIKC